MIYDVINDVTRMFQTLGAVTTITTRCRVMTRTRRGGWDFQDEVDAIHYHRADGRELGYLTPRCMGNRAQNQGVVIHPTPIRSMRWIYHREDRRVIDIPLPIC